MYRNVFLNQKGRSTSRPKNNSAVAVDPSHQYPMPSLLVLYARK